MGGGGVQMRFLKNKHVGVVLSSDDDDDDEDDDDDDDDDDRDNVQHVTFEASM